MPFPSHSNQGNLFTTYMVLRDESSHQCICFGPSKNAWHLHRGTTLEIVSDGDWMGARAGVGIAMEGQKRTCNKGNERGEKTIHG